MRDGSQVGMLFGIIQIPVFFKSHSQNKLQIFSHLRQLQIIHLIDDLLELQPFLASQFEISVMQDDQAMLHLKSKGLKSYIFTLDVVTYYSCYEVGHRLYLCV